MRKKIRQEDQQGTSGPSGKKKPKTTKEWNFVKAAEEEGYWEDKTNDEKIAYLREMGFPERSPIATVLKEENWNVHNAYWELMKDLVDNRNNYLQACKVS